jgi:hypothetical protein
MGLVGNILILALIVVVGAGCIAPLFVLGYIATDLGKWAKGVGAQASESKPTEVCDGCGSGPWRWQWDPDSKARKSRKFYCPNCTGAD